MLKRLHHSAHGLLSPESWRIRIIFWAGAIIVGLVASLFARAADYSNGLFHQLVAISAYLPLAVTPAMIMLATWLTTRFFPGTEGSGLPQCIAAPNIREENVRTLPLNWPIALGKILLTVLGLLSGASIGREGPTVRIGAAFNTPLAGILLAIEERSRSFEERTSGTLITAVILAGIMSIVLLGNHTYLGIVPANVSVSTGLLPVLLCAVAGGLLGGVFSTLLLSGQRLIRSLYRHRTLLVGGACGLIIALLSLVSGGRTYGSGHVVLLGSVASFAGVVQTPITTFVIVMEMTHNNDLLIALMATSFIAYGASRLIGPRLIYRALAEDFLNAPSSASNGVPPAEQRPSTP